MPKSKRDVPVANGPPRKKTRVPKVPDKTGFKQHDRKLIEKLRKLFEPKVKAKKKQDVNREDARVYHKLSAREVKQMVYMRFRSLTDFDGPVYMSFPAIAKRLNKYVNTVQYAIKHWMKHRQYVDRRKGNGTHVQYKVTLHNLESYILDKNTLEKWSGRGL